MPITAPPLPQRAQLEHGQALAEQLTAALSPGVETSAQMGGGGASALLELAEAITPDPEALRRGTSAVIDVGEHKAVAYFRDGEAKVFHRKLAEYGNPGRNIKSGAPKNNKLVAPIEAIRRPTLSDLAEPWDLEAVLDEAEQVWLELWVPGGHLGDASHRDQADGAVRGFLAQHGGAIEGPFEAAEHNIYLVQLAADVVRRIPSEMPMVTIIREPSQARLERIATEMVGDVVDRERIDPPGPDALTVAVLDTGIAEDHPLLAPTLVSAGVSVVPGITSAQDGHPSGHGTGVAGAAAYRNLATQIAATGRVTARCRIANVRLWDPQPSLFWAPRTEEAVVAAEAMPGSVIAHTLAISSGSRPQTPRTSWSFAVDNLAYNDGKGRLICVAAGNVRPEADPDAYPSTNLGAELHDPAQALNVLTVGGYTELDAVDLTRPGRSGLTPVARRGEMSPHTTTGIASGPIKPELLLEAGNACPDGNLPNVGMEELGVVTTSSRHAQGRLLETYDGTSIAAAALAGLVNDVAVANASRRSETIRALIVNSARWPAPLVAQLPTRAERVRAAGYGVPHLAAALLSATNRATLIHEDSMAPYSEDGKLDGMHLLRLPLPDDELLTLGENRVTLAVTLSYFIEPHETRITRYAGAWLQWDLQRQAESEADFLARINDRDRDQSNPPVPPGDWQWEVGAQARRRGSVQGDRLVTEAAALAGDRLLAVFPAGGWWGDHKKERNGREVPYAMVVTVDLGETDTDIYTPIAARIAVDVSVDAT